MFFSFSALVFISGNTVSLRATPDGCTHNLDCELNGVCNNGERAVFRIITSFIKLSSTVNSL